MGKNPAVICSTLGIAVLLGQKRCQDSPGAQKARNLPFSFTASETSFPLAAVKSIFLFVVRLYLKSESVNGQI